MSGSTGERPLGEIITSFQFWLLHLVNIPAVFLSGWLFVSTGLAYDAFGTPRPNEYFSPVQQVAPIIKNRFESRQQIEQFLQELPK